MITLKPEIISIIKKSPKLRLAVQSVLEISHTTLYKYLDNNDSKLANINVLETLKSNTEFKSDEELLLR